MKKKSVPILSVLLSLLLLAGCSGGKIAESSGASSESAVPTSLSVTAPATSPITTPQSGTTSTVPTTTVPITPPIPDPTYDPSELYEAVPGTSDLYLLDIDGVNLSTDFFIDSADLWGDKLLLSATAYYYEEYPGETDEWWEPDYTVVRQFYLIGLRTGKLLGQYTTDSELNAFGFLDDGTVYSTSSFYSLEEHQVVLYDDTLTPTDRFDVPDCAEIFCGMEGNGTLWFMDSDAGMLYACHPFGSAETQSYALPGYVYAEFGGRLGDRVFLSLTDEQYSQSFGILNLSDKNLDIENNLRGFRPAGEDLFVKDASEKWLITTSEELDKVKVIPKNGEYESIQAGVGDLFLTCIATFPEDEEDGYSAFSTYFLRRKADGAEIAEIGGKELSGLCFLCMDADGNTVFSVFNQDRGPEVFYWECQKDDSAVPDEDFRIIDLGASDVNTEAEQKIFDRFGVHVYYDEVSLTNLVYDYVCTPLDSPLQISEGLEDLYLYMSAYPEGFFEEVCVDGYSRLEIYLCGTFIPTSGYGISTAAAIASVKDDAIIMAFNLDYIDQMKTNLAHELMHVMEHRIQEYAFTIDLPVLEYWESLNPEDFSYYFSYHDENGDEISNIRYTSWDYTGQTEVWFVDPYSTSYPIEDRARIFENLYTETSFLFESSHMQVKAKYLCAIIRAAFPSVAESDSVCWEMFGEVSLEDYRNLLEDYQAYLYENAVG
ncbi:MAG: hypothetical protein ACI3YK_01845 [Eubacteriales bacterium]